MYTGAAVTAVGWIVTLSGGLAWLGGRSDPEQVCWILATRCDASLPSVSVMRKRAVTTGIGLGITAVGASLLSVGLVKRRQARLAVATSYVGGPMLSLRGRF